MSSPPDSGRVRKGSRNVGSVLVGLLTCVFVLTSALAIWAEHSIFDTERFTESVGRQLDKPVVTDALGQYVGRELSAALISDDGIERLLPAALADSAPTIAALLRGAIDREAQSLVASDRGQDLLLGAVRLAHGASLRLLEGDLPESGLVVVSDDTVRLNLVPVVYAVLTKIAEIGRFENLAVPELDRTQPPADQIAALGEALKRELSADFAQLTVYERKGDGSTIRLAQQALRGFRAVLWLLIAITLLLAAATVWIAPNRRRAAIGLGIGIALTGVVASMIARRFADAVPETIADPQARAAVAEMVDGIVGQLDRTLVLLMVLGGVLLITIGAIAFRDRGAAHAGVLDGFRASPDLTRILAGVLGVLIVVLFGLHLVPALGAVALVAGAFFATRTDRTEPLAAPS